MPAVEGELRARIAEVRRLVAEHAIGAHRDPGGVAIVAVTKTLPPAAVDAAFHAGLHDVGENYVQEARDKQARTVAGVRWHLIGSLQRNKARLAARLFDRVHSLDEAHTARALAREAAALGRRLPVMLQVNTAPGRARHGVAPDGAAALATEVVGLDGLLLDGLMTIAPVGEPEQVRSHFKTLREVRDMLRGLLGVELPHLSMGMSDDFVAAIQEGATMLRLGRVLFGTRGRAAWREGS